MGILYTQGKASAEDIFFHLNKCNKDFTPSLDNKVNIQEYASKIFEKAVTFEAWDEDILVGLVAAYVNDRGNQVVFITNVSVIETHRGKGIVCNLLKNCISHARQNHFKSIILEVSALNGRAILIYEKAGFQIQGNKNSLLIMKYNI